MCVCVCVCVYEFIIVNTTLTDHISNSRQYITNTVINH